MQVALQDPVAAPSIADREFANAVETEAMKQEQVFIATGHTFHAGTYVRTILIPKGVLLTGAEIRIPTVLILSGDALIFGGPNGAERFSGYHVLTGQPGRKNVFYALQDTWLSMFFATQAQTVEQAEDEFTAETEKLATRRA